MTEDLTSIVMPIIRLLDLHHPVTQQKIIEVLVWRHCERMGDQAEFTMNAMIKHIRQIRKQGRDITLEAGREALTGGGKTGVGDS
jgi:hypothetical protein